MELSQQKNCLVSSLLLAVTAPTKNKSEDCVSMVQSFGSGLTELEIEQCMQKTEEVLSNQEKLDYFFNTSTPTNDIRWF